MVKILFVRTELEGIDTAMLVEVKYFQDLDHSVDKTIARIKDAVTEWIASTDEGLEFWIDTCEDLNIGDLFCYGHVSTILPYLNKRGIKSVEGESVDDAVPYDTVLVQRSVIEDHLDELEAE